MAEARIRTGQIAEAGPKTGLIAQAQARSRAEGPKITEDRRRHGDSVEEHAADRSQDSDSASRSKKGSRRGAEEPKKDPRAVI